MLRILRTALALICFIGITLLFVDFTGFAAAHWGFLAHWQFIPAVLSLNVAVICAVLLITIIFGRIYCSVLCPLGVMQDIVSRLRIWTSGRRRRRAGIFKYKQSRTVLRMSVLGIFALLLILGTIATFWGWIAGLIEPYSAYGRIASQLFAPLWAAGNNLLADASAARDSYAFVPVALHIFNTLVFLIAVATLLIVGLSAWFGGRIYCNTICPVGTFLGLFSKNSLMRIRIDSAKCNHCGTCSRHCKASCIDSKAGVIHTSRCVVCMDCIGKCPHGALSYGPVRIDQTNENPTKSHTDSGRRNFIITGALLTGTLAANAINKTTDGGLTPLKPKAKPQRRTPIVPPGAGSLSHFTSVCTACQLCVRACPEGVIEPCTDLDGLMQPRLNFEKAYCRPDCTACSDICPTGALRKLDPTDRTATQVGIAVVDSSICISASEGVDCGSCARHCPAGAIAMEVIGNDDARKLPIVDPTACIGCGACEYHCPVGTIERIVSNIPAIHVEGLETQRKI